MSVGDVVGLLIYTLLTHYCYCDKMNFQFFNCSDPRLDAELLGVQSGSILFTMTSSMRCIVGTVYEYGGNSKSYDENGCLYLAGTSKVPLINIVCNFQHLPTFLLDYEAFKGR